jgi:hypothetical protein
VKKRGVVFGAGVLVLVYLIMLRAEAAVPFKNCQENATPTEGEYVPTSVAAERNRLEAAIQEWREDLRLAQKNKAWVCGAGTVGSYWYGTEPARDFESSNKDIRFLINQLKSDDVLLPRILRQMPLTPEEFDAYSALQTREQEISSCAMEVRSAINAKLFLVSIFQRIYKAQIDFHAAQMHQHKDFQESCVIREKRIERDRALIEVGNRLLPWYDILEKAN